MCKNKTYIYCRKNLLHSLVDSIAFHMQLKKNSLALLRILHCICSTIHIEQKQKLNLQAAAYNTFHFHSTNTNSFVLRAPLLHFNEQQNKYYSHAATCSLSQQKTTHTPACFPLYFLNKEKLPTSFYTSTYYIAYFLTIKKMTIRFF